MSINDSSRTFNPAAQAQAQVQQHESAPLQQQQQQQYTTQPTPTSTAAPPQSTQAPLSGQHQQQQHHQASDVLPGHHQSSSHGGVPQGAALGAGAGAGGVGAAGLGHETQSHAQAQTHGGAAGGGSDLGRISSFVLKQGGAYQAHAVVRWTTADGRSGHTEKLGSSIGFGHTGARSLRNKGIPDGARVRLTLDVLLGKTSEAKEEFIYDTNALTTAFYASGGTSLTADKVHLVVEDGIDA